MHQAYDTLNFDEEKMHPGDDITLDSLNSIGDLVTPQKPEPHVPVP